MPHSSLSLLVIANATLSISLRIQAKLRVLRSGQALQTAPTRAEAGFRESGSGLLHKLRQGLTVDGQVGAPANRNPNLQNVSVGHGTFLLHSRRLRSTTLGLITTTGGHIDATSQLQIPIWKSGYLLKFKQD